MQNLIHYKDFLILENNSKSAGFSISFKQVLVAMGLSLGILQGSFNLTVYKKAKEILDLVNSKQSIPLESEKKFIDSIKAELIVTIKNEKIFKQNQKDWIIDSLETIQFKVIDSDFLDNEHAAACYINLSSIKKIVDDKSLVKFALKSQIPQSDNFIILKREYIRTDPSYKASVTHEIFHYYLRLIKEADIFVPSMQSLIDKRLVNEDYMKEKIFALLLMSTPKNEPTNKELINKVYQLLKKNEEYYKSEEEMYARYKTLKNEIYKSGLIENINQPLTTELVVEFLYSLIEQKETGYDINPLLLHLPILVYLDFDKLDTMHEYF